MKGWFRGGCDDMRYFPCNHLGFDPVLKMPQPPEEFPKGPQVYADVQFLVINPEKNSGKSCLVIGDETPAEISIPIKKKFKKLWFLGALKNKVPDKTTVAQIEFFYAGGKSKIEYLKSGIHICGYQQERQLKIGRVAWNGYTPKYNNAVLWAVPVSNPHQNEEVQKIKIKMTQNVPMVVISMSIEMGREDVAADFFVKKNFAWLEAKPNSKQRKFGIVYSRPGNQPGEMWLKEKPATEKSLRWASKEINVKNYDQILLDFMAMPETYFTVDLYWDTSPKKMFRIVKNMEGDGQWKKIAIPVKGKKVRFVLRISGKTKEKNAVYINLKGIRSFVNKGHKNK